MLASLNSVDIFSPFLINSNNWFGIFSYIITSILLIYILSQYPVSYNIILGDCFLYFSNIFLTAREVGVNLKQGYNGDLSSKDAGRIGGQMVRKMIQQAENNMK